MIKRVAYPAWMLAFVALAVARHEIAWCTLAGAIGLGAQAVAARAWRTADGRVAIANLLTLARLALVVALPALFARLWWPLFVALVLAMLVLDGVDGWVARARGESSAFGAELDMETDALSVMALSLLLWRDAHVGAWVLAAGLWRYGYAFAVALAPPFGDCPKSPIYRWIFCVLVTAFAFAFVPFAPLARAFAAIGTASVSFSFLHSIVRSRAFAPRLTAAARPLETRAYDGRT